MAQEAGRARPKYQQIADDLRARIESGEYAPGSQLPTKSEMKERYGAALNTVDAALDVLRKAGLAESHQGSGTFVLKAPAGGYAGPDAAALTKELAGFREEVGERFAEIYRRMGWDENSQEGQDGEQRDNGRRQPRAAGGLQA